MTISNVVIFDKLQPFDVCAEQDCVNCVSHCVHVFFLSHLLDMVGCVLFTHLSGEGLIGEMVKTKGQ